MTVMNAVTGGGSQSSVPADERVKAWVVFDGYAATLTPLDSYNVASLTDNGVGQYAVNFTNDLPSANYAPVVWAGGDVANNRVSGRVGTKEGTTPDPTVSSFAFDVVADVALGQRFDADIVSVAFFGG